jgi:CheY-like chemotaxis protein
MEPNEFVNWKNEDSPQAELVGRKRNQIGMYSVIALILLVIAVILITFNIRFIAGIVVIGAASLVLLITRKTDNLILTARESFTDVSTVVEKKDDIIAGFSHKIREPLNNMVLITNLLLDSDLQKKQKELLETLIASTGNMVTTVNELTMQSAGNISLIRHKNIRYNILSTIQNTIDLYNLKEKSNLDIVFSKRDYDEFNCHGDPIILKQILLDIFNTIEEQGTEIPARVNINVRREKEQYGTEMIGIRIQTDRNNILIDPETGTGKLAMRLILKSKGHYGQESGENCTVLNINLPFNTDAAEIKSPPSSESTIQLHDQKRVKELKDCNLLLVEDNLLNQKTTILILKPLVKSIDTAFNGMEAIEKIAESKYDLILLDIQMPVMDGINTAEKIREMERGKDKHVPIIAITADAMIGDRERCISAGIDEYLSKPFQPDRLISLIGSVLNKSWQ